MEPPLHLFHLIKGLGRGGAERLLPQLARARGAGLRMSVGYFLPWKDALVGELEEAGCSVICFEGGSPAAMLARVPAVARWLERREVDLVHAHLPLAGVVARLAGHIAGVPVLYTEHNLQERYHPWTRRANLWTWRLQREVVAVSSEVADSIARHAPARVPVHVVLNGIETGSRDLSAGERIRRDLGIDGGVPVVGTVAVFRRQKRLDQWVEVAARIARRFPQCHFVLVGDGPMRGEVESAVERHGLTGRAHLVGLREEVRPFLGAMDVYLMTSEHEGLPLALLEAMAEERAVVVTAVGGIPEVVEDGLTGRLERFGDLDGLSEAVATLLEDADLRIRLGQAAREKVRGEFGIDRMAGQLAALYRRAVEQR